MARDFNINGETMVSVKGGAHNSGQALSAFGQLGLAERDVKVIPIFKHKDIRVDDFGAFGEQVPVEVLQQLQEIRIRMVLIHYDPEILNVCMNHAMGIGPQGVPLLNPLGLVGPAGASLGHGLPLYSSGNYYIGLNLASPVLKAPWRFPASYIACPPFEIPLGTMPSPVLLEWRAIPYVPLLVSGGSMSSGGVAVNGQIWTPQEISSSGLQIWSPISDTFG